MNLWNLKKKKATIGTYLFYMDNNIITKRQNKKRIGLHKFADVTLGITQKPLYIISSNMVR